MVGKGLTKLTTEDFVLEDKGFLKRFLSLMSSKIISHILAVSNPLYKISLWQANY